MICSTYFSKQIYNVLIFLIGASLLSACYPKMYGVANFSVLTSNVPKPFVRDSTEKILTASGSYHKNVVGYGQNERIKLYSGTLNRSVVTKNIYYSYGAFIYRGIYYSDLFTSAYRKDYGFNGAGIVGEFGKNNQVFNKHGNIKVGVKLVGLRELGSYAAFRNRVDTTTFDSGVGENINPKNLSLNFSFNTEVSFKIKKNIIGGHISHGIGDLGTSFGYGFYYSLGRFRVFYSCGYLFTRSVEIPLGNYYRGGGIALTLFD